ncbi:MAG TPA: glucosyl-3-phosphoglycerate synthase [Mycobacteriales bacterium]|nr:glucosyl-3-phosphoglycerate synthase [Mycobacteriales bacterium]
MTHDRAHSWLERRTYHWSRFADLPALVAAKGSTSVSLVLPARNEERTVGTIVRCLRDALMTAEVPLVDELVVLDHDSSDATARIAASAGATVVASRDVLSAYGDRPGKGEVLWKSLAATSGDVVAWVDADIENIDASFAFGLLGPLLTDPSVAFVKGFYERPFAERSRLRPTGGGRVTELVARPWLNMFWPDLAGLIQPLAGEQAGRRDLLERLPFVSGYGVEVGLLIDVYDEVGLDAIAQVDLERRVHRNQSVEKLGQMAYVIQQSLMSRLQREGRMTLTDPPAPELAQFRNRLGDYRMVVRDLPVTERPPLSDVPEYVNRRALDVM